MKKVIALFCLIILNLYLVGCGPKPLTDDEFVIVAQEKCQSVADLIPQTSPVEFGARSAIYSGTVTALSEYEITEKSAPRAFALLTAMTNFSNAQLDLDTALNEALTAQNVARPATLMIFEGGLIIAIPDGGNIFDGVTLEIDPVFYENMLARFEELKEAASAIGLEGCATE